MIDMRCIGRSAFILSVAIWSFGCSDGGPALDGTLLVTDRSSGSIVFIDLATRAEVARVPVGPIIPHEVAVSPDGRMALTSEYGPNDQPGRHIILIDVAAALKRADDRCVSAGTADAVGFQRLHQASIGKARRWLREVLQRIDLTEVQGIALLQRR